MSKREKLSATMAIALAETIDHGGELVLWQGGYWTYPNCSVYEERGGYRVPVWHVGTDTVRALISRGYFEVIGYSLGGARLPVRIRARPPVDRARG